MDRKVAEAIRQQSDDLRYELKELQEWEQHISSSRRVCTSEKLVCKQNESSSIVEPPIRGTVISIKEAMQSKLQESQIKNAKKEADQRSKAEVVKVKGNELFAKGEYEKAIKMYETGIEIGGEKSMLSILHANKAMCYLKLQNWQAAEREATLSLSANSSFAKAYYRRAVARKNIGNLSAARSDLESVLALSPNDVNATNELQEVVKLLQWQREQSMPINLTKRRVMIEEVSSDDSDSDVEEDENKEDVKSCITSKNESSISTRKEDEHANINDESRNYMSKVTNNNVNGKHKINSQNECIVMQADEIITTCTNTSSDNNYLGKEGKQRLQEQSPVLQAPTEYEERVAHKPHQANTIASGNEPSLIPNQHMYGEEHTNDDKTYNEWKLKDEANFRAAVRDVEEMRAAKTDLEWQRMQSRLRTSERVEIVADEEEHAESRSGYCTKNVEIVAKQNEPQANEESLTTREEMKTNITEETTTTTTTTTTSKNVASSADVQSTASKAKDKVSHVYTNICSLASNQSVKNMLKQSGSERKNNSERCQGSHDDICVTNPNDHVNDESAPDLAKTGKENEKTSELFSTEPSPAIARKESLEKLSGQPEHKLSKECTYTQKVLQRPKTFTEFERQISKLQNHNDQLVKYIQLLSPDELQSFFGSNITAEMLYTLLRAISTLPTEQKIKYLLNVCKIRRVGEVVLFFTAAEREFTKNLVASLSNAQITSKQLSLIKRKLSIN